jgi:predicted nucleic acid-binding protein
VTGAVVVDASVVVQVALGSGAASALAQRLMTAEPFAPELLDLEVLHAVRALVRRGSMTPESATRFVRQLPGLPVTRVSHRTLSPRIWELRDSVTAYDAAYVALAERLDAPLLTCDAKLAATHGHAARIELHLN